MSSIFRDEKNIRFSFLSCPKCGSLKPKKSFSGKQLKLAKGIPLTSENEKHYVSYCPDCNYSRIIGDDEWYSVTKKEKARLDDALKDNPDDPAELMKIHSDYINYDFQSDAKHLAKTMENRFPENKTVMMYLADCYNFNNEMSKAEAVLEIAYSHNKTDNNIRSQLANIYLKKGLLKKAESLMIDMGKIYPFTRTKDLHELAKLYFEQEDNSRAYYIFKLIAEEKKDYVFTNTEFRGDVKRLEKRLQNKSSILPKRNFNIKPLVVSLTVIALIIIGLVLSNFYLINNH